jgi:hypothetical protein
LSVRRSASTLTLPAGWSRSPNATSSWSIAVAIALHPS